MMSLQSVPSSDETKPSPHGGVTPGVPGANDTLRRHAWAIAQAGLQAVRPAQGFRRQVQREDDILVVGNRNYDLDQYDRVFVLGAGKATALIAQCLENLLAEKLTGGAIVVRPADVGKDLNRIRVLTASHPLPTQESVEAAHALLELANTFTSRDLVIACFTGGSSALVSAPPPGVSEAAKREVHELLLASGARIQQINAVRKNLSLIKGGALAHAGSAATWINITVSDVVGDELQYITDPTVPNTDSPADAINVLQNLGLWDRVHETVRRWLLRDEHTPSLKGVDIHTVVLASGIDALEAMKQASRLYGYLPVSLGSNVEGEAYMVGLELAHHATATTAKSELPWPGTVLLAAGGEVTVSTAAFGQQGGPNQELALSFAAGLLPEKPVVGLFLDSDGFDGPTPHAGGLVDNTTAVRLGAAGVDVERILRTHESTAALSMAGDLVTSGATGTNISDLFVIVVGGSSIETVDIATAELGDVQPAGPTSLRGTVSIHDNH